MYERLKNQPKRTADYQQQRTVKCNDSMTGEAITKEKMRNIIPQVYRHTYCSNMAKSGMNPKMLQYLMGHSDISVTLNTYTHLGLEDAALIGKKCNGTLLLQGIFLSHLRKSRYKIERLYAIISIRL